jgi:adenosylcobyric acid synthase
MTRKIMLQGTGSDVGKSVLVAGLCRLASNRGLNVRPFKPQNMSNNAAVSDDGGEIGRAQWLQALAARVPSSVHMNPVLLKPQSDVGSQIILQGKVAGQAKGKQYQALKPKLLGAVMGSLRRRRSRHRRRCGLAGRNQPPRWRHRQYGICHSCRCARYPGRRH